MKLYLAIKYHADQQNRDAIEAITAVLAAQGHEVYCITRDLEAWGAQHFAPEALMRQSFQAIRRADVLLVEFTEKGVGIGIEVGYAQANQIPIVVIARHGAEISTTLRGVATTLFFYHDYAELAALPLPTATHTAPALVYWHFITSSVDRLLACLAGLDAAALNWQPLPTANSLYVLATHLLGNLDETVLGLICGATVVRDREAEFRAQGQDANALQQHWLQLQAQITPHLAQLTVAELDQERIHPRRGVLTGRSILIIVARHAAEHLAHAELTRDLLLAEQAAG
ncbi:MAG: DinB family protein [Caldilineaceae bacterium]|nr:DinB family protein [Caldilineaceae bacterium]